MSPQEYIHENLTIEERNATKLTWFAYHLKNYAKIYRAQKNGEEIIKDALSLDKVLRLVCEVSGVTEEEVRARDRRRPLVRARQMFMFFAYNKTRATMQEIGQFLGRDHATALHGIRTIRGVEDFPKADERTFELFSLCRSIFKNYADVKKRSIR